jgi:hypothetical protein
VLIRYLAATDGSAISLVALEYLKAFLKLRMHVRVGSVTGPPQGRWEHYSQLLVTPMSGPFVNVVCCDPNRWVWTQRVPMPVRTTDGELEFKGEVAEGVQELRTEGVRNVLLTNVDVLTSGQYGTAIRYDAVVTPSEPSGVWKVPVAPDVHWVPIPVHADNLYILRRALTGRAIP